MKRYFFRLIKQGVAVIVFMLGVGGVQKVALADDKATDVWSTFELMPYRSISVKGDAAKFRAINWMNDGTTGGIKAMGFDEEVGKDGILSFDGHAIPGDNDFGTTLRLTKKNGGYVTMDYSNFRKWYDVYGGFYSNFTGSSSIKRLAADPKMDMGHFLLEIGSNSNILENAPGVSLSYERDTKEGIKSRPTWGTVTQTLQRKIAPAWEDVSEITDVVTLKGNTKLAGVNLSGRQRVEFSSGRSFREDDSTTALRSYAQEPQTKLLVSSVKADRWIIDDKTYLSFGYQYHHSRNDWLETIANYNTAGVIQSSSTNRVSDAQAIRDSHTTVQHFVANLTPDLNFVTKFKEEVVAQTGTGAAVGYSGGSDRSVESENQVTRTGQSVSLRYSGLPRTSLYTDWDFLQTRNWYSKDRVGSSHTEYLDRSPEVTGVMGVRYAPNSKFNMTSNIRRKSDHNTYDVFTNNDAGLTISRLQTTFNEWSNRMTWKPAKWIENSFRVQLLDNTYRVQSLDQTGFTGGNTDWIKSQGSSRIFTYNIVFQPLDEWMFDLGYSLNNFKVSTPASQVAVGSTTGGIPVFEADFHTWLFTGSYAPREDLSFFTGFQYTRAKDFDSHAFGGMPYGVDNEHYDVNTGIKWSPRKDLTISPHYGYYSYRANQSMDYGNYSAHVAWLDLSLDWF